MRPLLLRAISFSFAIFVVISFLAPIAQAATTFTVTTTVDNETGGDGICTLREAIGAANGTPANSDCGAENGAPYTVGFSFSGTIILGSELPHIARNMTIDSGAQSITVSGNYAVRVFYVNSAVTLNMNKLTVANGRSVQKGGGIYTEGTLNVTNSAISSNSAAQYGGGIYNYYGTVTVSNSTITNNSAAQYGGGISNFHGTVTVSGNSTISQNRASLEGGAGIDNDTGTTTVANSTISYNSATNANGSGGIFNFNGTLTVSNSTILGNTALSYGGICNYSYNNISNLNITNSTISGNNASSGYGGGVYNSSNNTATIVNSTISANSASSGGGVYNSPNSTATILNSTISGNRSITEIGGGILNNGVLTIANSTISGNTAVSKYGGGVYNSPNSTATIINSTISGNSATSGGGIYNGGTVSVKNSIVAGNPSGSNCSGTVTGSKNLSDDGTCGSAFTNSPSINLGVLGNNGGSTQTIPLLDGSAAVDTGDDAVCAASPVNNIDQRGFPRPIGTHCDIGAFEKCISSVTVTSSADDGPVSLRMAIAKVCSDGAINFGGNYAITLASQLIIDKNMTIDGSGHSITVSGNNAVRVFYVNPGVTFNMNKLTVTNGKSDLGGGIRNFGTLNVTNSTVSYNSAAQYGGGICNSNGKVTVSKSTISENSAFSVGGGGIDNMGTTTVTDSTISENSAINGNGGIGNYSGTVTVSNSTISGNISPIGRGGGIFNSAQAAVTLTNSIVAGNPSGGNCFGAISGSQNLADDSTCGTGFTNSPSINLGPLGNYGGSTRTIPLLPQSAAINAVSCTGVPSTDQRGLPRPKGARCDIGAYESQGFTLSKTGGDHQTAIITTSFEKPLEVTFTETGGARLPGVPINFTAPSSGASTYPVTFTAATGLNGVASATARANDTVGGPYSVVASVAGATGTNFTLENVAGLAKLIIAFAGSGSGTVTSTSPDYPSISCIKGASDGCSASYPLKTSVTLAASEDWKTLFEGWSGGVTSGLNPVTFIMDSDKTITSAFNPNYKVKLLPGGTLFASIQDAYGSVSTGTMTILAQVYSFPEKLLFNNDTNVTLTGGMDGSYSLTSGYSTVNELTVGKGQAVVGNIVIK